MMNKDKRRSGHIPALPVTTILVVGTVHAFMRRFNNLGSSNGEIEYLRWQNGICKILLFRVVAPDNQLHQFSPPLLRDNLKGFEFPTSA